MTRLDLAPLLERERAAVDRALESVLAGLDPGSPLTAPIRYAAGSGGKRLRPILCIAACRAVRGDAPPAAYRLASALELIHTYSLVHDDLPSMDDDAVRRGRAATHVAFGATRAAAAGVAMIPLAVGEAVRSARALGLGERERAEIVSVLCGAAGAGGMVGGQVLDLEAEGRAITADQLERIHRMKTGALLSAAPWLGGMAAGAAGSLRDALRVYGRAVGLAFQIMDDILDVTGSSAVLGKTAGRDTELRKATFPGLIGVERARRRVAAEVETGIAALRGAGLESPELEALGRYAAERDR